jgi:hypothetical protein
MEAVLEDGGHRRPLQSSRDLFQFRCSTNHDVPTPTNQPREAA